MRVVVPMMRGRFSRHFGKSDVFVVYEIDEIKGEIVNRNEVAKGEVACHGVAKWVADEIKADLVLAGGIGMPAKRGLERWGVKVVGGINEDDADTVMENFLSNPEGVKLVTCWGHEHCKTERCGQDD
ncbi:Dinitrogenase iron-molybdenum cofactor [Poriferisphaera corsica]|uniref:Dinitrogenase iron-molybdenum cofactor n=1 Tax=Poriferisphaera corsica TaxID=2528020 RepID=A0A517YQ46_9BACT|nr:NifB/NifX family molybdenum-iron cluster-binding protein [Poriferisphaera corsica]QDU32340.1 Dinitrogenase iron-molybdenum cofactor [Poriferisphaera corsica]